MSVRFVYFDVADTLLHKPEILRRVSDTLAKHGLHVSLEALRRAHYDEREASVFPARTDREFYRGFNRRFVERLGIPASDALALELFEACRYAPWAPFDDVTALRELKLPMGILSNWDETLSDKLRALADVRFEPVLGSAALAVAKPAPEFFLAAARAVGLQTEQIAMVGDSVKLDVEPARALGFQAFLLDRFGLREDFGPERAASLHEVVKRITC
jgi:HAD superfamily hydrolase (TIGR01509 family)